MASKIIDRKREFIEHAINWDIEFDVGIENRQIMKGHKILFEMGSAYFKQKIETHDRNVDFGPVRIDEMEPEEFKKFQEFLYTHRTKGPIESLPKTMNLVKIAQKCDVLDLAKHCIDMIKKTFLYVHEPENRPKKILLASNLIDRKRGFIEHAINWDIEFDVGIENRRIMKGHKILFEMGSAYFQQKFEDHDRNGDLGPVRIDEMEPDEFKKFQEFLYTNGTKRPIEDISKMIELAKKCDVPDFVKYCICNIEKSFIYQSGPGIKSTINLHKVEIAHTSGQTEIMGAVYKFLFGNNGEKVKAILDPQFDSEEFKHMTGPLLMYIMSHSPPIVSAVNLFQGVERFVNMLYEREMANLHGGYNQDPEALAYSEHPKPYMDVLFPRLKLEISSADYYTTIRKSSILTDGHKDELKEWLDGARPYGEYRGLPIKTQFAQFRDELWAYWNG